MKRRTLIVIILTILFSFLNILAGNFSAKKVSPEPEKDATSLKSEQTVSGPWPDCAKIRIYQHSYCLNPCSLCVTVKHGTSKKIDVEIMSSDPDYLYTYTVNEYKCGPITSELQGEVVGGAHGNKKIEVYFDDPYLPPGIYYGDLPINISESSVDPEKYLCLKLVLIVKE